MNFRSTRSTDESFVSSAYAIKTGLAPDGGLYMPTEIPSVSMEEIGALAKMDYPHRATYILKQFLTDYTEEELLSDCTEAYSANRFPGGAAPVVKFGEGLYSLELWHGPTCAFKDMALQIMPRLLSRALTKTEEKNSALILVATSGDTGKAALEGYRDVPKIKIQVFYPEDGVSTVQKLQMQTQLGDNVNVTAIKGNFDDAQTGVKKIFSNPDMAAALLERGYIFSSANSINWGRLAPQIVYYFSAYCDLVNSGALKMGDLVDFCVPTGNFGNIFAGYLAKRMGLPVRKLICASNSNNILTDFLTTGSYDRNRAFYTTMSPSMDILISSNLERLLYLMAGPVKTAEWMAQLSKNGVYQVDGETFAKIKETFVGFCTNEEETAAVISETFANGYLCDTHTAVAIGSAKKYLSDFADVPMIVVSTASPYKFAQDVYHSLGKKYAESDLHALSALSEATKTEIPAPLDRIGERTVRFQTTVAADEMSAAVLSFLDRN